MSFVSSKPDPYPTPVDVVVHLISAIMNRVIKRFYCILIRMQQKYALIYRLNAQRTNDVMCHLCMSIKKMLHTTY